MFVYRRKGQVPQSGSPQWSSAPNGLPSSASVPNGLALKSQAPEDKAAPSRSTLRAVNLHVN